MRLVAGALALTLIASVVRAEETPAPAPPQASRDGTHRKVPFRVVRVMPESRQALLFDRVRATHVLAEVGATLEGYTVEDIDADEVTLRFEGTHIVLAAPAGGGDGHADRTGRTGRDDGAALPARSVAPPAPTRAEPMPLDPYGEPAIRTVRAPDARDAGPAGGDSPVAPGEGGAGAAIAQPIAPGDGGVRVVAAPGTPAPPAATDPLPIDAYAEPLPGDAEPPAGGAALPPPPTTVAAGPFPIDAYADGATGDSPGGSATPGGSALDAPVPTDGPRTAAPAPAAAGARPAPAAPVPAPTAAILTRGDVTGALDDFARLASAIRARFSATGVVVEEVTAGSIFHRAGLRAGDVITAIDGARLRSLDDAANLYARAATATAFSAQILRAGKPVTLRVTIQ